MDREQIQKLIDFRNENNLFAAITTGVKILDAGEDWSLLELKTEHKHLNPQGTVQGGVMMTMADAAMSAALMHHNQTMATVDMHFQFLRPAYEGDTLIAKSHVVKSGRTINICQTDIFVGESKVGTATATFVFTGKIVIEENA